MLTLLKGKSETIKLTRSDPALTVTGLSVFDPTDASEPCTATVDNDATDTTLDSSASRNTSTIIATGLTAGTQYHVTDTTGKTLRINVIGVEGTTCTLRDPLPYGLNTGAAVKGIESTSTFTVPAAYDQTSVTVEWSLSDGDVFPDELITSKYKFYNSLTSDDLYIRWSRLKNNEPSYQKSQGLEFQPQIDRAVDMIRDKFWRDGHVLDRIRSPKLASELIVIQTGMILVNMGFDLAASTDASDTRADLRNQLKAAYIEVLGATNLWRDEDEDRIKDAGDLVSMGPVMSWS